MKKYLIPLLIIFSFASFAQNQHIIVTLVDSVGAPGAGGGGSGSVFSIGNIAPTEGLTITGTNPITTSGTWTFALANDLAALENLSTFGLPVRTASNAWAIRTITGSSGITVTDPLTGNIVIGYSGSAITDLSFNGNSTIDTLRSSNGNDVNFEAGTRIAFDISTANKLKINSIPYIAGNNISIVGDTIKNIFAQTFQTLGTSGVTSLGVTLSNGGGGFSILPGANVVMSNDGFGNLTISATAGGGGGSGTVTSLGINQPSQGITFTSNTSNPITSSGTFTVALANDLLAVENLSTFGVAVRNGTSSWTTKTISGGSNISVTNGDGLLAGNIIISYTGSGVTGAGISNYVTKWNSSSNITTSSIQDNGSTIGMNGASPTAGILTQWPSGDIRIGSATSTVNRLLFGDGANVYIGEEILDDRLSIRASSLMLNLIAGGGTGSSGQVLTSNGTTVSWQTPVSGGGGITGSGSTFFLPVWNTSSSLTSSMFQQDAASGSWAGIGATWVSGVKLSIGSGDTKIGSLAYTGTANRLLFGDGNFTYIGEEGADDRLILKGGSMGFNVGGSTGTNGQVPIANGSGTWSWGTVSGGGGGGAMSLSGGLVYTITGTTGSITFQGSTGISITNTGTSGNSNLLFTAADNSPTNEAQTLNGTGNAIILNAIAGVGGGTINVTSSGLVTATVSGNVLNIIGSYSDPDNSATNEIQSLGWGSITSSSATQTISSGGTGNAGNTIVAGSNVTFANVSGNLQINANLAGGAVSGSGTTNFLSKWNGASSLTNSLISDNGSVIFLTSLTANGYVKTAGGTGQLFITSSVSGSDVTGNISGNASSITGSITESQVTGLISDLAAKQNTITLTTTGSSGSATLIGTNLNIPNYTYSDPDNSATNEIQSLTGSANAINLSLGGGSVSVTSSGLVTATVSGNVLNITGSYSDPDNSATNEIQTLSLVSNTLSLSLGGGSVSLAAYVNTDAQTLSLVSNTLSISGGNNVSLAAYVNTDAQTLSLVSNTLSISGGNSISLAPYVYTAGSGISVLGSVITNTAPHTVTSLSTSQSGSNIIITPTGGTPINLVAGAEIVLTNNNSNSSTISENVAFQSFGGSGSISSSTRIVEISGIGTLTLPSVATGTKIYILNLSGSTVILSSGGATIYHAGTPPATTQALLANSMCIITRFNSGWGMTYSL